MATGRTVSASFLTELDKQVIELCSTIAETIQNSIQDKDLQKEYGSPRTCIFCQRD
ncbi:MAG: hypothetical protein OHK0057_22180 [Thermoflexibacter sp.]